MSLYQEAVKRAGGPDRVCEKCKAITEAYDTALGVRAGSNQTPNRPYFTTTLLEAFGNSTTCWHCGWLAFLTSSTWLNDIKGLASPGPQNHKIEIGWQSFQRNTGNERTSPSIGRMTISYIAGATEGESAPQKKTVIFSKSTQIPRNITSMTVEGTSIVAQSTSQDLSTINPYEGRIRPAIIDAQLLRRWKECCLKDHGGTCDQTFMTRRVPRLRFVDVNSRCIVEAAPEGVTWAALSYCWGGPQIHALQQKNLGEYQRPGSLTDEILPPGIVDAMAVTRALGERYIWIDSLCIIQDDDKDKLEFIAAMGTIYAHALVTIINAANDKVSLPMPGIRIPRRMQQLHQFKDYWLVEALDLGHSYYGYLEGTTWNTRGWTFQEGLLSPRCLVISQQQAYWQCKTSSWCEDSCWEVPMDGRSVYRHYSGSSIMRRLTDSTEENWMGLYKDIIDMYTSRELTAENDRLGAVQAILDVLRRDDEEGYFWGMPKGHMEMALTWTFHKSRNTRRDCDAKFMGANDDILSAPFPTWSWLGWHGVTPMPTVDRALLGGRLGLKFYQISQGPNVVSLVEKPFVGPERDFSKKEYMKSNDWSDQIGYPRDLPHPVIDYDKQSISLDDIPPRVLSSAEAPSALCFWTSTAVLSMAYERWNGYHNCPLIALSHGGVSFYSKWDNDDSFKPLGEGKFIVIGTERTRMSHGGDVTVNLLLVEQDEKGLSRRSRLVTYTPEKVWESLENRRWELVFLV